MGICRGVAVVPMSVLHHTEADTNGKRTSWEGRTPHYSRGQSPTGTKSSKVSSGNRETFCLYTKRNRTPLRLKLRTERKKVLKKRFFVREFVQPPSKASCSYGQRKAQKKKSFFVRGFVHSCSLTI